MKSPEPTVEEGHARDRRRFFNPETIEPIARDHPLRDREECLPPQRTTTRCRRRSRDVEEHGKQADQRVDDHVAEDEQRDAQESVGAAQIDLQLRHHPFPLLRLKQAGLRPVLHHPLLRGSPARRRADRSSFVTPESSRQHHEQNHDDRSGDDEVDQPDDESAHRVEQPHADARIAIQRPVRHKRESPIAHAEINRRGCERQQARRDRPIRCPAPARRRSRPAGARWRQAAGRRRGNAP